MALTLEQLIDECAIQLDEQERIIAKIKAEMNLLLDLKKEIEHGTDNLL